jgi:sugar phosphate isomerase/epimerase
LGVSAVQVDAVGELAPANLTGTARREIRTLLRSYSLEVAAVNCPLRYGLDAATDLEARLARIREAMNFAYELGANRVVVPMPRVPTDAASPTAILARDSLENLGQHGDRVGTLVGLELGLNPGEAVRDYLKGFELGSLGVTFDPANLMLNGFDPVSSLMALSGLLVFAHARDARRATVSGGAREAPAGVGDLDWLLLIATLESLDYRGYLCVEREPCLTRLTDVANSVGFLRRFTGLAMS